MTARNANDATTIRTELKAWGLSSRNALLMTEKLLPQMIVIRSRRASRGLKNRRRKWGDPVTGGGGRDRPPNVGDPGHRRGQQRAPAGPAAGRRRRRIRLTPRTA